MITYLLTCTLHSGPRCCFCKGCWGWDDLQSCGCISPPAVGPREAAAKRCPRLETAEARWETAETMRPSAAACAVKMPDQPPAGDRLRYKLQRHVRPVPMSAIAGDFFGFQGCGEWGAL